jgi:hypothetical protein
MTGPLELVGIPKLVFGLIAGMVFGVLLDKGRVTHYKTITGQFLFKDFTMLKLMLSAVLVGSVGVYFLVDINAAELRIMPVFPARLLLGSMIFGIGMGLLGY